MDDPDSHVHHKPLNLYIDADFMLIQSHQPTTLHLGLASIGLQFFIFTFYIL